MVLYCAVTFSSTHHFPSFCTTQLLHETEMGRMFVMCLYIILAVELGYTSGKGKRSFHQKKNLPVPSVSHKTNCEKQWFSTSLAKELPTFWVKKEALVIQKKIMKFYSANAACTNGSTRIIGGPPQVLPAEGFIQVCSYNQWYHVCDYGWSQEDAMVACKSLQFSALGK